jgi:multidrug efflux pump subunit AcrB
VNGGAGENRAFIMVALTPYSMRTRTADQIIDELRPEVDGIQRISRVTYVIDTGGPPVGKPIALRVIGSDDAKRLELAEAIAAFLRQTPGVSDVETDQRPGKDQVEIQIDYGQLARVGLTVADVAQNVRIAYDGEVVTSLRDGDEDVDFRVQMLEAARRSDYYLRNLSIPNRQNRMIKLGAVARLETKPGPSAYRHYGGERTTTVEANVDQAVTTALEVSSATVASIDMADWPDLRLEIGGEAEESEESIVSLLTTFSIAFVGIYFLLVLLFDSFTQPFLVLFSVPFGLIGVIIAFGLHGENLSFMAVMGVIGLIGVVVNDSLVLVDHLNTLRRERPEDEVRVVVGEGAANRLRAIVLTSVTTAAGLLPLAYGIGGTDIYMQPMALSLGWGILFATPLTLVLIPCLYMVGYDIRKLLHLKQAGVGDHE